MREFFEPIRERLKVKHKQSNVTFNSLLKITLRQHTCKLIEILYRGWLLNTWWWSPEEHKLILAEDSKTWRCLRVKYGVSCIYGTIWMKHLGRVSSRNVFHNSGDKTRNIFLCFFTELKTYNLCYSIKEINIFPTSKLFLLRLF